MSFAEFVSNNYVLTIGIAVILLYLLTPSKKAANTPPMVPYTIPFVGSAIEYGVDPIGFMKRNYQKYGDCFTFLMAGRRMTFCLGPDGNHFVFNVPIANASAEAAYETLTVPVFGKNVVYDVPNAKFMEQKKFVKDSFSQAGFQSYIPKIWKETDDFFQEWREKGTEKLNIFMEMSELTIRTASLCLMGKEVRERLQTHVAKLYHDLDAGLAPINVFFRWLPLPVYFNRDRAHKEMSDLFKQILNDRRKNKVTGQHDLVEALEKAVYKDGTPLDDDSVAHLMIAMLMGGQHTSSTTSSWVLFEIARRPDVVQRLREEQSMVLTGKPDTPMDQLPMFTYEQQRQMVYLECVLKETLRLHAPIHTIMRKVEKEIEFKGHTIPVGDFLCGSAQFSQMDEERFPDAEKFMPERFMNNTEGSGEWTINGVDIAQKSARSHFLPFGAGRHRCIGEQFGYLQIKTIVSKFVREFDVELYEKFPKPDFTSLIVVPEKPSFLKVTERSK
ncbi:cytochrome P450 [Gorgonomyces haynaldii]|nr:cytochrome P450 [Gorgonomyces haynaldii]